MEPIFMEYPNTLNTQSKNIKIDHIQDYVHHTFIETYGDIKHDITEEFYAVCDEEPSHDQEFDRYASDTWECIVDTEDNRYSYKVITCSPYLKYYTFQCEYTYIRILADFSYYVEYPDYSVSFWFSSEDKINKDIFVMTNTIRMETE